MTESRGGESGRRVGSLLPPLSRLVVPDAPRRRERTLESAFGRVAEFVLHRGHRDITRVTLAGADRDARRCLCIAARALHLALSCERAPSRSRLGQAVSFSLDLLPPSYYAARARYSVSFFFFPSAAPPYLLLSFSFSSLSLLLSLASVIARRVSLPCISH